MRHHLDLVPAPQVLGALRLALDELQHHQRALREVADHGRADALLGGELKLIDYEYSGNNDACFELGNIWSESNLARTQLDELVTLYYGAPLRNKIARAWLWGVVAKYGWMLWASIQDGVSELEFDFWSWGMEKYERAVMEFDGPDFETMLSDVQRED